MALLPLKNGIMLLTQALVCLCVCQNNHDEVARLSNMVLDEINTFTRTGKINI